MITKIIIIIPIPAKLITNVCVVKIVSRCRGEIFLYWNSYPEEIILIIIVWVRESWPPRVQQKADLLMEWTASFESPHSISQCNKFIRSQWTLLRYGSIQKGPGPPPPPLVSGPISFNLLFNILILLRPGLPPPSPPRSHGTPWIPFYPWDSMESHGMTSRISKMNNE